MKSNLDTPLERVSENYISQYYRFEDFLEEDADIVYTFNGDTDELISFYNRFTNLHFEAPPTLEEYSNYDDSLPIPDYTTISMISSGRSNDIRFLLTANISLLYNEKDISTRISEDADKVSLSWFASYALMFPRGCRIEFKG